MSGIEFGLSRALKTNDDTVGLSRMTSLECLTVAHDLNQLIYEI